jgi:hypothetical protein
MNKVSFSLIAMLLVFSVDLHAGNFYRCGNAYQDHPCVGQQQKSMTVKTEQTSVKKADGYCSALGDKAKKIMWAREVGRTEQMQLEATNNPEERSLISEVYRKRGSSLDVKNQVEADCMAEKEKAAQAAALIKAAAQLQGSAKLSPPSQIPVTTVPQSSKLNTAAQQQSIASQTDGKKQECTSIKETIDSIYAEERQGALSQRMESLRQERNALEREAKQLGC